MTMSPPTRRTVLGATVLSAGAAILARPALAQGGRPGTLRFIPQSDLTILDPLNTTAYPTRNHGHLCWDTLYGVDDASVPQPQLAEGHTVEDDGRTWLFTLRDGPTFHDGEKVLARDAVASIRRWMQRDTHGQTLAARLDEIAPAGDRRFTIRLKRPFGALLEGLAKASSYPCFIYPERFATQDATKPVTEVVGSGPYRFVASERVPGSLAVYRKFTSYVPTPVGQPSMVAGPKLAEFERLEWHTIPDGATAAVAMQSREMDWWELLPNDLEAVMKGARGIKVARVDQGGIYAALRFNQLLPPFDDPAVRRAVLAAVDQSDFMQAVAGDDPSAWRAGVGYFPVGSPYASDAGMAALTRPRDLAAARAALAASGAAGAAVTALHATDVPAQAATMAVGVDLLSKLGFKTDDTVMDFGALVQRRMNKAAPAKGGWNVLVALFGGSDLMTPVNNFLLRGNGADAWFGWPTAPALELLREQWLDAADEGARKQVARALQEQALTDVPFIPLGQYFYSTATRADLAGIRNGMVLPLNVKRT